MVSSARNYVVRGGVGKETHVSIVVADDTQVTEDGCANLETTEPAGVLEGSSDAALAGR